MIIKIDHENNGEIFWDAVEAAGANCPPALAMLRDGHTEAVNVSEQDAAEAAGLTVPPLKDAWKY